MKKRLVFIMSSFFCGTLFAQIPSGNLVARYEFCANANDGSGNGLNGLVTGATPAADRNGNSNSSYNFAVGSRIVVSSNALLNNSFAQGITLAAWVNIPNGSSSTMRIIDRTPVGVNNGYMLDILNGRVRFIGNISGSSPSSTGTIPSGSWVHIAATVNNTTGNLTYYINGVASGSFGGTNQTVPANTSSTLNLILGQDQNGGNQLLGTLDEVTIYGRPLTSVEVNQLATSSSIVNDITGSSSVCVNQLIELTNATAGGTWTSSTPSVATVSSTGIVKGIGVGTSTITYTVTIGSCTFTKTKVITVNSLPSAFTIDGLTVICPNLYSPYTVNPITSNTKYYWVVDNNISNYNVNGISTQIRVYSPPSGTYNIKAVALNSCGVYETTKTVSVNSDVPPSPNVSCSGGNTTNDCPTLTVTNNAGYTVEWNVGGTIYNNVTSVSRPVGANVTVKYTSASGCTKSRDRYATTICNSYRLADEVEILPETAFKIYPSPSNGLFTIETAGQAGTASIVDVYGRVVKTISLTEAQQLYSVTLDARGTYIIKIKTSNETKGYKLVVE